jgi:DNA-binding GntR family transcriptional regulator
MTLENLTESATSLTLTTYERLRSDVLSGRWVPGGKLGIEALREHYGTGATPVREALNRLAAEGWVQHLDQRGFIAAPVSDEALRELAKTRVWLETTALTQSIQASTPAWEERVLLALHRLSKTPRSLITDKYVENPAWEKLHREFHMALIDNCGSRWLIAFCEQLYDQAYRYRQLAAKTSYKRRHELDEHKAVVDAVLAGDATSACNALTGHYDKTAQIILKNGAP